MGGAIIEHGHEDGDYGYLGLHEVEDIGRDSGLGASERDEEEEEEQVHQEGEMEVEDDDEDTLLFQGEMDPLRFAEEDENGQLPYEQFQRLEYETLAARKRKHLATRS
jgi:hypothetical protein